VQGDYFILCTKASCQHFSPPRRNFFHHKSYSFLSRTVRLTNSNPKALLLGCRGTLAQNRGTMGVQIPFSFPKSLDFKPLQTKVRILPWQTKSIFIILTNSFKCYKFMPNLVNETLPKSHIYPLYHTIKKGVPQCRTPRKPYNEALITIAF